MRHPVTVGFLTSLVAVGVAVGGGWSEQTSTIRPDATITTYETRIADLEGTAAVLETRVVTGGGVGTPVVDGLGDLDPAELVDRLLATAWTVEEFPIGKEAEGEERTALANSDEGVGDIVGGVAISWAGGPWTLSYIIYATETEATDALSSALNEGVASAMHVSVVSSGGVDGSCLGPPEVVPGSPDSATCITVSGNVLVSSVGDDHDASRFAFLLVAGVQHIEVVRAA